ncbi:MAG TPA: VanW family protein [Symbiobacteriaceae bacterium]|nr:VanW family protein [Symbiobacteriaceae bacterium]
MKEWGLRRWFPAGLVVLGVAGAGLALGAVPPRYEVRLRDRPVAAGRDLGALSAGLQARWEGELAREVTLTAGDRSWTYQLADLGLPDGRTQLAAELEAQAGQLPWWERLALSHPVLTVEPPPGWLTEKLEAALLPIRAEVERQPVDATFHIEKQVPVITPETNGTQLETGRVLEALKGLGEGRQLALPVTDRAPAVTRASLEAMHITRVIAEWTTHYDPSIPRADNVERAARAFNGLILKPGEILSYNATVGPVDEANGWKEAFVIVNGELVPGVGGGVCQVATTFYGAALRANLDILERHPHQLAVAYIAPSQDAAIAQGWEDLKIRNTSLGHLYIETEAGGGSVTFRLYGDQPKDQEVRIESQVLGSRPYPTKVLSDPSLAPGQQVVKVAGNNGLISEAYRAVYVGGKLVKRERLSQDEYLPTTQVVLRG